MLSWILPVIFRCDMYTSHRSQLCLQVSFCDAKTEEQDPPLELRIVEASIVLLLSATVYFCVTRLSKVMKQKRRKEYIFSKLYYKVD